MADARREMRRKKILENSTNRLKLITGDIQGSYKETLAMSEDSTVPVAYNDCSTRHIGVPRSAVVAENTAVVDPPASVSTINPALLVIPTAVLVRLLFVTHLEFLSPSSVLVPFLLLQVPLFLLCKRERSSHTYTTILLRTVLANQVSPNVVELASSVGNCLGIVFINFATFFFAFLIFHVCVQCFS